jgi:hypothetical protein
MHSTRHARTLKRWLGAVLLIFASPMARSQSNIVENGSFETVLFMPFQIPPWTWTSTTGALMTGWIGAGDGVNYMLLGGTVYQDLVTVSGQQYRLRFAMAGNWNAEDLIWTDVFWGDTRIARPE